ncbi:MAG: 16S rRNA (cytosine(1402)-N(4))-methyltransferase RsmH, partial [Bacillota bacterium]|nr:16S rRNA (cytosine(1402)-N(4))-methyltransferase RsmH [Bacillota bacterium]
MDQYTHTSVLLQEAIDALAIRPDGVYVDATLGGGGHALAILKRLTTGTLYAFDQDAYAIAKAKERLSAYPNIEYVAANFADLETELKQRGIDAVDGVLYDLGVSSFQFDMPERGFSYQHDSPLDMRMNKDASFSAYDLVNTWTPERIAEVLFRYGEEPFARPIAKAIAKARALKPIKTTFELVDLIKGVLPAKILAKKGHPAKQTFQAIRIAVNDELDVFASSLSQAAGMLKKGGRIVVITFHSLEDRIA